DALNDWFALARTKLCENEKERFRILSRDTAEAVEGVLKQLHPGVPELQAAGLLSCAMWERGIEPISLFVGADDRSVRVRHFIPTDKKASEKLIASVCARRNGLVVSLTRTVYFRPVTDREKQAYMGLLQVEADTFNSIAAGTNLGDVFLKIRMAYRRAGMDQEWEKHHQGGLTGYLPREIRIDSGTKREIRQEEAYAFNLTCPGAKVEETVLLTGEGLEIMTGCVDWPTVKFEGRNRPDLLVL
ncbi:MAG: M24 family metallopeptidase, partial [Desulfovibrionaceae bacterium]|nr:M24 family metallopeptidase [Desulfovibrionaceae bacterium]